MKMILHVTTGQEWKSCNDKEYYAPDSLATDGFIHACQSEQLKGVLERYFAGRRDLVLLHIDETRLRSPLVHERGTGGEMFPHIYGRINKDAITASATWTSAL